MKLTSRLSLKTRLLAVLVTAMAVVSGVLLAAVLSQKESDLRASTAQRVDAAVWAFSRSLPHEATGFASGTAASTP